MLGHVHRALCGCILSLPAPDFHGHRRPSLPRAGGTSRKELRGARLCKGGLTAQPPMQLKIADLAGCASLTEQSGTPEENPSSINT